MISFFITFSCLKDVCSCTVGYVVARFYWLCIQLNGDQPIQYCPYGEISATVYLFVQLSIMTLWQPRTSSYTVKMIISYSMISIQCISKTAKTFELVFLYMGIAQGYCMHCHSWKCLCNSTLILLWPVLFMNIYSWEIVLVCQPPPKRNPWSRENIQVNITYVFTVHPSKSVFVWTPIIYDPLT